jgi:hypothetical protein
LLQIGCIKNSNEVMIKLHIENRLPMLLWSASKAGVGGGIGC